MSSSELDYSEESWNPTTGCTQISSGCIHCYAKAMAIGFQRMGKEKYRNGFNLTLHPDILEEPYTWRKSKLIFVGSMSDLFHRDIPIEFIQNIFRVMKENPRHIFLVLTKRADQLLYYDKERLLEWTDNIWAGVTVEDNIVIKRIDLLRQTGAKNKFLSCEPLLSALPGLNLTCINWVVVGGESGRGSRQMREEWAIDIRDQCLNANVPFYFKQWGGVNAKEAGRLLEGRTWDEKPKKRELTLF